MTGNERSCNIQRMHRTLQAPPPLTTLNHARAKQGTRNAFWLNVSNVTGIQKQLKFVFQRLINDRIHYLLVSKFTIAQSSIQIYLQLTLLFFDTVSGGPQVALSWFDFFSSLPKTTSPSPTFSSVLLPVYSISSSLVSLWRISVLFLTLISGVVIYLYLQFYFHFTMIPISVQFRLSSTTHLVPDHLVLSIVS